MIQKILLKYILKIKLNPPNNTFLNVLFENNIKEKVKEADVYFIVFKIFIWDENSVGWNLLFRVCSVNKLQNM